MCLSLLTWSFSQDFPDNRSPTLSPPITLVTQELQYTETALPFERSLTGTAVPQPTGPILGAQEERMRQVSLSGGYLYSCETHMPHLNAIVSCEPCLREHVVHLSWVACISQAKSTTGTWKCNALGCKNRSILASRLKTNWALVAKQLHSQWRWQQEKAVHVHHRQIL